MQIHLTNKTKQKPSEKVLMTSSTALLDGTPTTYNRQWAFGS